MTPSRWISIFDNICLMLNCLLLFFVIFGEQMQVPVFLQVAGRMHPLVLHFPIVLMLLAAVWELGAVRHFVIRHSDVGDVLLCSAAVSAALAALMGLLLSQEGGYDEATLLWHQWSGVAVSLAAWGWYAFRAFFRAAKIPARLLAAASVAALLVAGHQGATLTHGENYLLAPVAPEKSEPVVSQEDALVYEHLVRPILKEKCMGCHNASKSKGDLVMDTEAALLRGGEHGVLWDTAAPQLGLMMQRIHLPTEEKEHMPPKGKAQLTAQDVQILEFWIKSGASFSQKIIDLDENNPLRQLAAERLQPVENEAYNFAAADEATIRKLNSDYRAVYPLALNSPALGVDFYGAAPFRSEHLRDLQVVSEQVVSLNLSRMPLTDNDLKIVSTFQNLRALQLSATSITGAGLPELNRLSELRSLSLASTGMKAADLEPLRALPRLAVLYLWNTGVTAADLENLRKMLPHTRIELGYRGEGVVAKLNAPLIEGGEQVFEGGTKVKLKNYIRGAELRYTLDGSVPDSITSLLNTGDSIVVEKTSVLTARAFLPGWLSSEAATRSFYKIGLLPDSVALTHPPNPQYKGEGPKTLANKKIGDTDFRTNKWLAYRENDLEAFFFFQKPVALSSVSLSTLVDVGSYIMPAAEVQVWGGHDPKRLTLLKKWTPKQPDKLGMPGYRTGLTGTFDVRQLSVLKIVAKPVAKLPAWHPGKGERGWVFVDEIFFE